MTTRPSAARLRWLSVASLGPLLGTAGRGAHICRFRVAFKLNVATLMDSGVEFVAVDNPHANKLTVHILAAVAQHEREMISQRTKDALQAAKARGTQLGNPRLTEALPLAVEANKEAAERFAVNVRSRQAASAASVAWLGH